MVEGVLEYATLALFYSLLAGGILEVLLRAWRVKDPPLALAFRLGILAIPPVAPLLFDLLTWWRPLESFRRRAVLLDLQNWLGADPSPYHPGWILLVVAMAGTTLLLAALELSALLRRLQAERSPLLHLSQLPDRLQEAADKLSAEGYPPVRIAAVAGGGPAAWTIGFQQPTILVTTTLVEMLDGEELEAVLAHEMAHAVRRDNRLSWLIFLLRLASFYNPVALFTFHQISHDVERVCDGEAAAATGKPLALASALVKVHRVSRAPISDERAWPRRVAGRAAALENRAREALVVDRVQRLVYPERLHRVSYPRLRLGLAVVAVLCMAYLVV